MKRQDDLHVFIMPTVKYLAVAESKTNYVTLDNIDLCKPTILDKAICKTTNIFYNLQGRPICETE